MDAALRQVATSLLGELINIAKFAIIFHYFYSIALFMSICGIAVNLSTMTFNFKVCSDIEEVLKGCSKNSSKLGDDSCMIATELSAKIKLQG